MKWRALLAAAILLLAYFYLILSSKAWQAEISWLADLRWNWLGKSLASLLSLMVIAVVPGMTLRESGVVLRQNAGSVRPALICLLLICAWCWLCEALFANGTDTATERLVFQALMPGIDEELFFRSILLALLMRALRDRWTLLGARVGPAAAISLFIFSAGHALSLDQGGFAFDPLVFTYAAGAGAGLTWMRLRTGSILLPVLAHNLANLGESFF